jgi:hypothetical protein
VINDALGPSIIVTRFPAQPNQAPRIFQLVPAPPPPPRTRPLVPYSLSPSSSTASLASIVAAPIDPQLPVVVPRFCGPSTAAAPPVRAPAFQGMDFRTTFNAIQHPILSRSKHFPQWQSRRQRFQNNAETAMAPIKERAGRLADSVHGRLMYGLEGVDAWLRRAGTRTKAK